MLNNPNNVLYVFSHDVVGFWCPGCDTEHHVKIKGAKAWKWNESMLTPTFEQSVLVTSGHHDEGHAVTDECWCTYNADNPGEEIPFECTRCHCFINEGVIRFLDDSSHRLAGMTLPLQPHPLSKIIL